jgi:hypothetical protein
MVATDWIEMAQAANSNEIGYASLLITIMSGYLVVAYLVGTKLSRAQVTTVNALYVVSSISMIAGLWQNNYDNMLARHHAYTYIPDMSGAVSASLILMIPTSIAFVYSGLIIASLFFMWSIRHPRTERPL